MNSKKFVILVVGLGLFAISTANVHAQMHRNAGFASHASTSRSFIRSGAGTFSGHNWGGGDWHHHHHGDFGSNIFISSFGFPNNAWYVDFTTGEVNNWGRRNDSSSWCVRGGQGVDAH